MTHYKSEQLAQDEKFDNQFAHISMSHATKEGIVVSGSKDWIKSYLFSRDQALLEAFKKDVGEMRVEIEDKTLKIMPEKYWRQVGGNSVVDMILSLLKDYKTEI